MNNVLIKFELGNQLYMDMTRLLNVDKAVQCTHNYVQLRH